jgi:hypothetical protein
MTFGNSWKKWTMALGVFAVLLLAWFAGAQNPPKIAGKVPVEQEVHREAKSGKHHEKPKPAGPIVDNWKIQKSRKDNFGQKVELSEGTVNLTLNSDGSWNFSGQMNQQYVKACHLYVVIAVKSSEGTLIPFSHSASLNPNHPESYSWEKQGNNRTVKDNFKAFQKDGHDWAGHWKCLPAPRPQGGVAACNASYQAMLADLSQTLAGKMGITPPNPCNGPSFGF